jgi:hypothetical protein
MTEEKTVLEPPQSPEIFDVKALKIMQAAAQQVLSVVPEVRSVVVVFDYKGELNDSKINKGLWLGEGGGVSDPRAILGTAQNMVAATLETILRAASFRDQLQTDIVQTLQKIKKEAQGDSAGQSGQGSGNPPAAAGPA